MRCDGEPVRPGIGTTRLMSRVFKPAKQIGTRSAYTIRASGNRTPRQQAGHKTVPDMAAISSKCPCKAGAIHTRCDGEPVRPGIGTTRLMSRVFEPAKQIGTRSAYTIRASGNRTPRQQAGHKTVPDMAAISSKCPCKAGAIHTRCDGEPVRPGIGTTRLMSRVFKPAKQIGTRSAYTIRASGNRTPRQQAGHKTVPDMAAISSKCPCKAGAIHTRCDGEPVRPGIGTTRLMSRVFEPAKQIGTRSAYTIRASGNRTPRQQAGHKTVPDMAAISSKCPCKAGAIHTRI